MDVEDTVLEKDSDYVGALQVDTGDYELIVGKAHAYKNKRVIQALYFLPSF